VPSEPASLQSDRQRVYAEDGRLTLTEIATRPLPHAELAFLSACQTATGDEELSEEAIHLAGGMLTAGFRSVVATMWSVRDRDAPFVAERVYSSLLEGERIDCVGAGLALYRAIQALRERVGEVKFRSWVPYIHMGV
jgi:CHAT domain-containing protein